MLFVNGDIIFQHKLAPLFFLLVDNKTHIKHHFPVDKELFKTFLFPLSEINSLYDIKISMDRELLQTGLGMGLTTNKLSC